MATVLERILGACNQETARTKGGGRGARGGPEGGRTRERPQPGAGSGIYLARTQIDMVY